MTKEIKPNILLISASNPSKVSGVIANNMCNLLNNDGFKAKILTLESNDNNTDSYYVRNNLFVKYKSKLISKLKRRTNFKFNPKYYFYGEDQTVNFFTTRHILKSLNGFNPDIIIILFTSQLLNAKNIVEIEKNTKAIVYWYFMDMQPMTGGCSYSWECNNYYRECGKCPAINSNDLYDQSYHNLNFKFKHLEQIDINILCASTEILEQAQASSIFKRHKKYSLPLGIDSEVYKSASYVESQEFRSNLKIENNSRLLFCGAVGINEERKGFNLLIKSLYYLKEYYPQSINEFTLIVAGKKSHKFLEELILLKLRYHFLGFLDHQELISTLSCCDGILIPSLHDSGPLILNQALMSGLPILSFDIGIAKDFVINEVTGYKSKIKSAEAYAESILNYLSLDNDQLLKMKTNCRNTALEKTSNQTQLKLFKEILLSNRSKI